VSCSGTDLWLENGQPYNRGRMSRRCVLLVNERVVCIFHIEAGPLAVVLVGDDLRRLY